MSECPDCTHPELSTARPTHMQFCLGLIIERDARRIAVQPCIPLLDASFATTANAETVISHVISLDVAGMM